MRILAVLLGVISTTVALASRDLEERLTTSKCPTVRAEPFQARLDLYYFYLVETGQSSPLINLDLIERSIGREVVKGLDGCEESGQPQNAVQLTTEHVYTAGGECLPLEPGNSCLVARGITSVLLDSDPTGVEASAYTAIENALANASIDLSVIRGQLIQPIGESLVLLSDEPRASSTSSSGVIVGLTSTITVFVVAGAFVYGIRRRGAAKALRLRLDHEQAKRRHFFGQLGEEMISQSQTELSGGWMTTEMHQLPPQGRSVAWSVSDLTSDSHSIKSSLKMDRIVEEEAGDDVEVNSNPSDGSTPTKARLCQETEIPRQEVNLHHLNFVAHWSQEQTQRKDLESGTNSEIWCSRSIKSGENENDEAASTPIRRNRISDFDARGESRPDMISVSTDIHQDVDPMDDEVPSLPKIPPPGSDDNLRNALMPQRSSTAQLAKKAEVCVVNSGVATNDANKENLSQSANNKPTRSGSIPIITKSLGCAVPSRAIPVQAADLALQRWVADLLTRLHRIQHRKLLGP